MKAAVTGRVIEDDAIGIDRRALRGTPRRARGDPRIAASERLLLLAVLGLFEDRISECRRVGELAVGVAFEAGAASNAAQRGGVARRVPGDALKVRRELSGFVRVRLDRRRGRPAPAEHFVGC